SRTSGDPTRPPGPTATGTGRCAHAGHGCTGQGRHASRRSRSVCGVGQRVGSVSVWGRSAQFGRDPVRVGGDHRPPHLDGRLPGVERLDHGTTAQLREDLVARQARRVPGPERLLHARPEVAQPHAYTLSRTGRSANASSGVAATAASRVSVGYPVRSTTNPDTAPPTAPARPIPTSARPCADGLTDSGTDSLSSAEPATIVPDHPSPSRNSPA